MDEQRKLEIINTALLKQTEELIETAAYWKRETDKAWESVRNPHVAISAEPHPEKQADCGLWQTAAEALWDLMDDIDTLSDSIRPRDAKTWEKFYRLTMELVKRRGDYLRSDGQKLFLTWPNTKLSDEA